MEKREVKKDKKKKMNEEEISFEDDTKKGKEIIY